MHNIVERPKVTQSSFRGAQLVRMRDQKSCKFRNPVEVVCNADSSVPVQRDKRELFDPREALAEQAKSLRDWNALVFLR